MQGTFQSQKYYIVPHIKIAFGSCLLVYLTIICTFSVYVITNITTVSLSSANKIEPGPACG